MEKNINKNRRFQTFNSYILPSYPIEQQYIIKSFNSGAILRICRFDDSLFKLLFLLWKKIDQLFQSFLKKNRNLL